MKIASSNVNLVSSRQYYEENSVTVQTGVLTRQSFLDSLKDQAAKSDKWEASETAMDDKPLSSENYSSLKPSKSDYLTPSVSTLEDEIAALRTSLLERILKLFRLFGGDTQSRGFNSTLSNTAELLSAGTFVKVTTVSMTHIESEETTFSGTGSAQTEDGRVIDFNVDFSMSRRLCEYAGVSVGTAVGLIDPLVVNVGSGVTQISDQSFYFDLDCDGNEDKISNLGSGSGFLALDRDGDGRINDGSELFGTKSGDGFHDLSEFDKDANGWIDENDEVYESLKIWLKNEDGTDTLLGLKEADVGAIYLGSANTQFSHIGGDFALSAMTRSTGLFLRESGGVGTVQQVDMAAL
jgi:hypothetical protein